MATIIYLSYLQPLLTYLSAEHWIWNTYAGHIYALDIYTVLRFKFTIVKMFNKDMIRI